MNIMDRIRGFRDFASQEQIMRHVERGMNPEDYGTASRGGLEPPRMHFHDFNQNPEPRNVEGMMVAGLVFFHTTYQKTMLVKCAGPHAAGSVKCLLDDKRKNRLLEEWEISREEVPAYFNPDTIQIYDSKHPEYGYLDFGPHHRGWYYSKKLFNGKDDLMNKLMAFAKLAAE